MAKIAIPPGLLEIKQVRCNPRFKKVCDVNARTSRCSRSSCPRIPGRLCWYEGRADDID